MLTIGTRYICAASGKGFGPSKSEKDRPNKKQNDAVLKSKRIGNDDVSKRLIFFCVRAFQEIVRPDDEVQRQSAGCR